MAPPPTLVEEWIARVVDGCGGFHDLERYEYAVFPDRDIGLASFVVRALANPKCEGSDAVLQAISERREALTAPAPVQEPRWEPGWWCCSADYPNHDAGCPNAAPVQEVDRG